MTRSMQKQIPTGRRAFTLTEVMAAMAVLLLLFVVLAQLFYSTRQVVSIATAQGETHNFARALESNLRRDLMRLSRDGFMVLHMENKAPLVAGQQVLKHTDQLLFFSHGPFASTQTQQVLKTNGDPASSPMANARSARIWYGHLDLTQPDRLWPDDFEPHQWALGRQALLLANVDHDSQYQPNELDKVRALTLWDHSLASDYTGPIDLRMGTIDAVRTDLLTIRRQVAAASDPLLRMYEALYRPVARQHLGAGQVNETNLMALHALLATNCDSFRIQFAGDYDRTMAAPSDGKVDMIQSLDDPSRQEIKWYGLRDLPRGNSLIEPLDASIYPDLAAAQPSPASVTPSSNVTWPIVFGYDQERTPWPAMLRITVNMHDTESRLHGFFLRHQTSSRDGRSFQFVIDLSQ